MLDAWSRHDWSDGIQVDSLTDLDTLSVRTENSLYEIVVLSHRTADILVRGGRFFPDPTRARLAGSSLAGSFLKLRGIYIGFNMELHAECGPIVTSRVRSIDRAADARAH